MVDHETTWGVVAGDAIVSGPMPMFAPVGAMTTVPHRPVESLVVDLGPDEFCRRIHPGLVGALRLYLGDAEVADELAQDTLVRVVERWTVVSAMDHPEGWAFRVAFNLARSGLRRRLAERRALTRLGPAPTSARTPDVAETIEVRAAIASLPPRQRQAVVLRYYGDLTVDQVAEAMGCRAGTVKAHLHQALAALRDGGLITERTANRPTSPEDLR